MQTGGIGPNVLRVLSTGAPDLVTELLAPGRVLEADVVSVFGDRAMLSFGRGLRLEVALQAALREGDRVRVQIQPRGAAETVENARAAIVMKLIESSPGSEVRPSQVMGQTSVGTPPQPPADGTRIVWLPIPLPDGSQGWAQLQVKEEPESRAGIRAGHIARQVRLWWETPALGTVQVTLDEAAGSLAAHFTVPEAESRRMVDASLPDLLNRLREVGFPEARAGCRALRPGESVAPAASPGSSRLDRRL